MKDERHRGSYKALRNKALRNDVVVFDADGKELGVVFEAATPFDTPRDMEALVARTRKAINEESLRPRRAVEFRGHGHGGCPGKSFDDLP